ncbi:hypothetical protein [Streptomyces camelliae]|uniref:hypothetical protein n=1 Tax=Streptomyces camelliae TaxID=3004093 RepID=UPI003D17A5C2
MVPGPSGVALRRSLKGLTERDVEVLHLVGDLLGSLACRDLKARCAAGLDPAYTSRWGAQHGQQSLTT